MEKTGAVFYRYGFNGQEKDNETNAGGNLYTAQYWEYDARIGRRWNLDPKPAKNVSAYSVFGNNPLFFMDPLGDTIINGQKYEPKNFAHATYQQEVFVTAKILKKLPNLDLNSDKYKPYSEIVNIALDRNMERYAKLRSLRSVGYPTITSQVGRNLDGVLLKNILSYGILKSLEKGFTALDITSVVTSYNSKNLEIPMIGGVTQMIVDDMANSSDELTLKAASESGYTALARVINSSVGKHTGLLGAYTDKKTMESIIKNGGINMQVHTLYGMNSSLIDDPRDPSGNKFDYFIVYPQKSTGLITNFGVIPVK